MRKISNNTIQEIILLRSQGMSYDNISKIFDIHRDTITKYCKHIVLTKDQKYQIRSSSIKKYVYNESVLLNNDHISYYLLGAFMTDGNISSYYYQTSITSNDQDWVESIRNLICPNKPISKNKEGKAYTLRLSNKLIVDWFISNKCKPNKSLTLEFPNIPNEYLKDFIRGCMDGDGCYCIYNAKGRKSPRIYSYISSASEQFIIKLKEALLSLDINGTISKSKLCNSIIRGRKVIAKNNLFRLHFSKTQTIKLIQTIYYENCLCMPRKLQKTQEILKLIIIN